MSANGSEPARPTASDLVRMTEKLTRTGLDLWAKGLAREPAGAEDPLRLVAATMELGLSLMRDPMHLARAQLLLLSDYLSLGARWLSGNGTDPVAPPRGDRRFRDAAWNDNLLFDTLKQGYLMTARGVLSVVEQAEGIDDDTRQRLLFAIQQVLDALAPSNFVLTNPQVLRTTLDSGGANLISGLENLLDDLADGGGRLDVRMTDPDAFKVGDDLAVTPGEIVFQNDLMQLIQYEASTDEVHRRPLLMVPPWMNKYYVLDLRPGNSFIEWLVDQGHTVFVISWVNPDAALAHKSFEHYMLEGPLAAMDAIEQATGEREVNVIGYCLGGILIAAALAYLRAKQDSRVRSATLLTTMVDFREVGEIGMFIDEEALESLEQRIWKQGYLDGRAVYDTFRALRANDLIWSFYVNNYLLGNKPAAFDLLHWNADSTNMPAAMHTYFMRNMYLENRMRDPGGVTLDGVPIDVRTVRTPSYVLSTIEDHIAPWRTTYYTTQLFGGPVKFVLGESGHIAGVINPPEREKYGYWLNADNPPTPQEWLDGASRTSGSWWPDWNRWMRRHLGGKVPARIPGAGALPAIERAPGSYVLKRLVD